MDIIILLGLGAAGGLFVGWNVWPQPTWAKNAVASLAKKLGQ